MARIAFLEVLGCVNRDEIGQEVVGRVLARCAPGSQVRFDGWARAGPGARRGWLGVRPEGVCWEPDAPGVGRPPWVLARCAPGSRVRFEGWVCAGESDAPPGYSPGSRVRVGEPGARWGVSGVAGHAPGGRLRGVRRAGGYLGRTGKLGGRGGRLPTRAPACPAHPRAAGSAEPSARSARASAMPTCPARPRTARLPTPRAPCWPSRPPVAPATSACPARPRTAGLPTFCPRPAIRAFSRQPCKFGRFCTHRPPFASASRLIVSPLPTPTRGNDDPPRASVCLLAASRVQNRPNLQKRRLFPRIGPRAAFCAQPPTGASRPRVSWQPASLVYRVVGRRPAGPSAGARFFSAAGRLAWRRHARSPILIKFETPRGRAPRARPLAENARDLG